MTAVKLKICGMKDNPSAVADLKPDFMGFIFYEDSPRNFDGILPKISRDIQKVGVFVDAEFAFAKAKTREYQLDVLQLHGNESPAYIKEMRKELLAENKELQIWKVFSIKDSFDFTSLEPFEGLVDAFLFDTKGKNKGGNGYTFDWSVLKEYPSKTPFILSGGIGLDEVSIVREILTTDLPIYALDVNSKFELQPGLKDLKKLEEFKKAVRL